MALRIKRYSDIEEISEVEGDDQGRHGWKEDLGEMGIIAFRNKLHNRNEWATWAVMILMIMIWDKGKEMTKEDMVGRSI